MFKKYYSRFLNQLGDQLHFAAHSHHAWPDISRDAHLQYWDDSSKMLDDKWEYIFSEIIPETQKIIASFLQLRSPEQIAFAPNTHELLVRLLSTFELKQPIKILTTHHEFHSFRRQIERMAESNLVSVTYVQAGELNSLKEKLQNGNYDLFFMSQVFFDSGIALSAEEILELTNVAPKKTLICIDGYHAFAAIPLNLSKLEGRIFYLAGGYKYAQAGEGMCFMVVPEGKWRPVNTGWFAEMGNLSGPNTSLVQYPDNASAFLGSTQDFSAFYRFNAVWSFFEKEGITISAIHSHVEKLQEIFLSKLTSTTLSAYPLINFDINRRGHFLTFDLKDSNHCASFAKDLKKQGVFVDYRGQRLRIGFGMYQNESDILKLMNALKLS